MAAIGIDLLLVAWWLTALRRKPPDCSMFFKEAQWQVTIINMQHLQQVSGRVHGSEEGKQ